MKWVVNGYLIWEPPLDPPDEFEPKPIKEISELDLDLEEASMWY